MCVTGRGNVRCIAAAPEGREKGNRHVRTTSCGRARPGSSMGIVINRRTFLTGSLAAALAVRRSKSSGVLITAQDDSLVLRTDRVDTADGRVSIADQRRA